VYTVLMGKLGGKRPQVRPRRRFVYKIRMDLLGEGLCRVLVGKPKVMRPLGDLGVDGWIILGWI